MRLPAPPEGFTEDVTPAKAPAESLPAAPEGFTEDVDPTQQSYLAGLARSALGQGAALGWGDELVARIRQLAGEDYDTAVADERAKLKAFRKANPKAALAGELAGSFATPGLGLLGGVLKPAASLAGRMVQGAGVGATVGGIAGAGAAEKNTGQGAVQGAGLGAVLGPAAPVLAKAGSAALEKGAEVLGPTLARAGARMRGAAPDEAAADSVMKSWMRSGGDTPQSFRKQLADVEDARQFYSNSLAESPVALADLSPSMQKLAGSVTRSSPEAATRAETFIGARQTGLEPKAEGAKAMLSGAGVETRNPLAPAIKGEKPAGQYERVKDALKRALLIEDSKHHGHARNAYQTEQELTKSLQQEAAKLYGEARSAAQNFNMQPVIKPVAEKWAAEAVGSQITEGRLIRRALQQFTTDGQKLVTSLDAFDKGKRALDSMIEVAINKGDRNAARVLKGVKDDMVSAADAITAQKIGEKYRAARDVYSSRAESKDAIDMGRKAFRENSDVVADQFNALSTGDKKLFRLGMLESFEQNLGARKRANDITQIFDTPRMQELLRTVIPRTVGKSGKVDKSTDISRNPERFDSYIGNEKLMVETNKKVIGGSPTQPRAMDDARLTRQTVGEMFDRYRQSPSLFAVGMEAISTGLNKVFGFREDVAQQLARRLFTANPAEREAILTRLEAQWGPDKIGMIGRILDNAATATSVALPAQGGRAIGEARK